MLDPLGARRVLHDSSFSFSVRTLNTLPSLAGAAIVPVDKLYIHVRSQHEREFENLVPAAQLLGVNEIRKRQ